LRGRRITYKARSKEALSGKISRAWLSVDHLIIKSTCPDEHWPMT
jgi:hypothetical protein